MAITDELGWLQDTSAVSPLFGGNKVYFVVDTVERSSSNIVTTNPRVLKDLSIQTGETRQTRLNRLKAEVGHSGFEAREWTISGPIHEPTEADFNLPSTSFITSDELFKYDFMLDSNFDTDTTTTPTRNLLMALSANRIVTIESFPRTLYLYDPKLIKQLIRSGSDSSTNFSYAHYTTNGVPVIITSATLTTTREGDTTYSITFTEDKELT